MADYIMSDEFKKALEKHKMFRKVISIKDFD